ncbi:MAG: tetratricopeptide (TPR) repeat protein [Planctomycetota bacterium]|jgi:tetratricopeptide (TPR) repeat protein
MNTASIPTTLSVLFLVANAPLPAHEVEHARLAHHLDPPARVLVHLASAQAFAADGDIERALDQVESGLTLPRGAGALSYDKARLELWAIQWREREVLRCIQALEIDQARDLLMRMSEPLVSPFSQHRLAMLETKLDKAEAQTRRSTSSKVDRDLLRVQRRVDAGMRLLNRADKELGKALAKSNLTVYSARRAHAALRHSQEVERSAARWLRQEHPDRAQEQLLALQLRAGDRSLRAMLQIAESRTMQGDFREALTWVGRVLQTTPSNQQAQELRRTIQVASAASAGWLGGIGPAVIPRSR